VAAKPAPMAIPRNEAREADIGLPR
jgi:hypothetical protein